MPIFQVLKMPAKNTIFMSILFIVFAGVFAGFLYQQKTINGAQEKITKLTHDLATLEKTTADLKTAISDPHGFAQKLLAYDTALGQLQKTQNDQDEASIKRTLKIFYTINYILAQQPKPIAPANAQPFLYFTQDAWQKEWRDFITGISGLSNLTPLSIGDGENDELRTGQKGSLYLDGIFYRGLEKLSVRNSGPNTIFVNEPAIVDIFNGEMQITTDPLDDTVILDGCLTWKQDTALDGYTPWIATDSGGNTRIVKITTEAIVKIQEICDQRYIAQALELIVPPLWKEREYIAIPSAFPLPAQTEAAP